MKKLFLSLMAVVIGTVSSSAQTDQIATLSHGTSISTYYGGNALVEAYAAAAEGDIITLSSGTFTALNIEKAITVRGAGMIGLNNGIEPTHLNGAFSIKAAMTLEGVNCKNNVDITGTISAPVKVYKSRFPEGVDCTADADFVHCLVNCTYYDVYTQWLPEHNLTSSGSITIHCFNCVLNNPEMADASTDYFENCIIAGGVSLAYHSYLKNCIILDTSTKNALPASSTANNCVPYYVNNEGNVFANVGGTNYHTVIYSELFKTYGGVEANEGETFELTETAAATYLGDDGKQVGIYGGTNPFNPIPSNPQVTKFTVNSSANNGQLSVKINVE